MHTGAPMADAYVWWY